MSNNNNNMGAIFNCFDDCSDKEKEKKAEQNINTIIGKYTPYSCIEKLDTNDLSYEKLKKHIKNNIIKVMKGNGGIINSDNFDNEYQLLTNYIDYDEEHMNQLNQSNMKLCRYSDITTYIYNTITIGPKKKFINASSIDIYSKHNSIATQGPKKDTIEDFWTMVDEYNCSIIIMLCNLEEGGREKCAFYWDTSYDFKNYKLENLSEDSDDDKMDDNKIVTRKFKLTNIKKNTEKIITQYHYKGWPDHGVPVMEDAYKAFKFLFEEVKKKNQEQSAVVHCSAGVGRTGTFLSLYYLYLEIMEQINKPDINEIKFSIFNIVRKLKEMRAYLVQTNTQYKFIYDFITCLLEEYNKNSLK